MSDTFIAAVIARSADARPLVAETDPSPQTAQACNAVIAALNEGDIETALDAADAAVSLQPRFPLSWTLRARCLNELQLFADVLVMVPYMQAIGAAWQEEAERAQSSLQSLFQQLPVFMQRTASSDADDRLTAWQELAQADPTSLQARTAVYNAWLQEAMRMRESETAAAKAGTVGSADGEVDSTAVASQALACLKECAAEAIAFRASEVCEPPHASSLEAGNTLLLQFLGSKRPNIPLAVYGEDGVDRAEADVELNIGLALELGSETSRYMEACTHYERSASLDSSSRVYTLWEAAAARADGFTSLHENTGTGRPTALRVHQQGVAAGLWEIAEQRPTSLIRGLTAKAWHDPQSFTACRKLEAEFTSIRAEAFALLQQDATHKHFCSYNSKALTAGDWCDVGLYYNGMRNDQNAKRAPRTSALLGGDDGGFRRDCTSCSIGSAYFSLLRPHTRLAAHCGPTNARLRAHLGLVVPHGDCEIIVGGETRKWVEGKVVIFDDSFEHEVHNDTDEARLVLIVDLWHPMLVTDQSRVDALEDDQQRRRYRDVVDNSIYESTTLRGH